MLDRIFEIDSFNVFSDDNYYYFFRALNMADNNDIETGITLNSSGTIERIRTNLERYEDIPKYTLDDKISLEQVFDHIKMHQRKDTNCISLTSNSNTAITYGRGNYKDKYVMIRVPKSDINISTFEAGLYMLKEVNNRINEMIANGELSEEQVNIIKYIDSISSKQQLDILKNRLINQQDEESLFYDNGLERLTSSVNYLSLNDEQNFEKDKIVLKLDLINKNLLKGVSNSLLIQTIGNAFSSLEMIHYGEISKDKIIDVPKELMDILGLIQQLPNTLPNIQRFKSEFLSRIPNIKLNGGYDYKDFVLDDNVFSLDNIYALTYGKVSYGVACELYKKAYYFAKSKIRMNNSLKLLKQITGNNGEYKEIYDYIENHTYGIEPEITTRISSNKIQVSESVSLDFSPSEKNLFDFLKRLNLGQLNYIMNNPNETLKVLLNNFIEEEMDITLQTKEKWYANSIIDMLDLTRLGVKSTLSFTQRNDLVNSLIDNNFYERYIYLKQKGYKGSEISSLIFNSLIRNTFDENLNNLFSLEELEYFIGYNRVKGTGLHLRPYQKHAVKEINKKFKTKQFTSAILPTGAGKSFVALAEMYKYRNKKILYLAPNVEILNQVKSYIRKIYRPEEHIGDKESDPIKRMFPNVIFDTYQHLKQESAKDIISDKYSLIVFDELHRTGANEWQKQVKELLDNQDEHVKVLGITATPERDADLKDMTDYWAKYYGYTDEEIIKGQHLAINMDLAEAIRSGYVVNPKVLNCEYSLITGGDLEQLKLSIDDIQDENIKGEKLKKYEYLRRNVEKSNGIEQILADNLKSNGKYIVFLPVTKKDDGTYEDQDGNIVGKETAEKIILSYKTLMKQYLFSAEYFKEKGEYLLKIYEKIESNIPLFMEEQVFLSEEKENILLLSQINIRNKPSSLNTKNNIIIEKIIEYSKWEKYSEKELTKKINNIMREKVEDYSMLGSYSDKKNKANLDSFNSNTSSKIKFMFVMNKLNEGVHVDDIDGIVWLRPLDFNSKILYLQQLGRCIYSLNPNMELDDSKRPLVLDLVNNTLKVKLDKGVLQEEIDLNKLLLIKFWIIENYHYPNYETSDKIEREYAISLNSINRKYNKYFACETLLEEKSIERKILIKEILNVGSEIDLWSQPVIEYEHDNSKGKDSDDNDLLEFFELSANIREFIDLSNDEEDKFEVYYGYLVQLKKQGDTTNLAPDDKIKLNKDGTIEIVKKIMKRIDGRQVIINAAEYNSKDLINVGNWLYNNQKNFTEEQKQRLRDIGYVLNGEEDKYETYYGYLVQLKKQGDTTNLTGDDKIKLNKDGTIEIVKQIKKRIDGRLVISNVDEYNSKDLINVGSWLYVNQSNFTEKQKQRLRDIGYVLRGEEEDKYETYYGYLVQLKKQGDTTNLTGDDKIKLNKDGTIEIVKKIKKRIDGRQVIINSDDYNSKELINVGLWLYNNQNKFTKEQKQRLRDIGYVLNGEEDKYETYYGYLVQLKKQGDTTNLTGDDKIKLNKDGTIEIVKKIKKRIDGRLVISNVDEYNSKDLINVGSWLYKNQSNFTEEQKQRLREIGYVLKEDKKKKYDEAKEKFDETSEFSKALNSGKENKK